MQSSIIGVCNKPCDHRFTMRAAQTMCPDSSWSHLLTNKLETAVILWPVSFNNITTLNHIKTNMPADTTNNTASVNSVWTFSLLPLITSSRATRLHLLWPLAPTASSIMSGPTSPNPNPAETASINPFRSKMDPRMKKSI